MAALSVSPFSVLITGANRGLGLEFVKQLASRKPKPSVIMGTTRSTGTDKSQELEEIAAKDPTVKVLHLDCTDESSIATMADEVDKCVGEEGLTLLINNAGMYESLSLSEMTADVMKELFLVNSIAPLLVTKSLLPLLELSAKKNRYKPLGWTRAAIVNITSGYGRISGKSPVPYAYGASKAALNFLTNNIHKEFKDRGIVATAICPGWVNTDMGGKGAPTTPTQSVRAMLSVIESLDDKDREGFYQHNGKLNPW